MRFFINSKAKQERILPENVSDGVERVDKD